MSMWTCARCGSREGRKRNRPICDACHTALTADGLRWCSLGRHAVAAWGERGYCHACEQRRDQERRAHRAERRRGALAGPTTCAYCPNPLSDRQRYNKRTYCSLSCAVQARTHRPHMTPGAPSSPPESATPAPLSLTRVDPQNGSCAVGDILGREGQTVYRVDLLNGRLYVYDDRGVYCPLAQWATSTAARRLAKQGERSVFDEVPASRSVWRNYAREVEG